MKLSNNSNRPLSLGCINHSETHRYYPDLTSRGVQNHLAAANWNRARWTNYIETLKLLNSQSAPWKTHDTLHTAHELWHYFLAWSPWNVGVRELHVTFTTEFSCSDSVGAIVTASDTASIWSYLRCFHVSSLWLLRKVLAALILHLGPSMMQMMALDWHWWRNGHRNNRIYIAPFLL